MREHDAVSDLAEVSYRMRLVEAMLDYVLDQCRMYAKVITPSIEAIAKDLVTARQMLDVEVTERVLGEGRERARLASESLLPRQTNPPADWEIKK